MPTTYYPSQTTATGVAPQRLTNPNQIPQYGYPNDYRMQQPSLSYPQMQQSGTTGYSLQGVNFGSYSPTDTLRTQQIAPGYDPRLGAVQGGVDQAAQNLMAFDYGQYGNPTTGTQGIQTALNQIGSGYGAQTAGSPGSDLARQIMLSDLQGLGTPDRGQIAQDTLTRLVQATEPQYQQQLQQVGQRAASLGRLGSGVTTSDLGDVAQRRNEQIAQQAGALSSQAAALTLQDQLDRLGAASGVGGQLSAQDLARGQFGLAQGQAQQGLQAQIEALRRANTAEQQANRAFQFNQNLAQGDLRNQQLSQLAGLEGQQYAQNLGYRNELRGERDFQNQMANQATADQIQQIMLEDQLLNSAFGRDQARLGLLSGSAYGGLPTGALQGGADYFGNQAGGNLDTVAQLLWLLGQGGG